MSNNKNNAMKEKEEWADDVLRSLDGLQRAEPNVELFARITNKVTQKTIRIIPLKPLAWVAAAACFIITINLYTFYNTTQISDNTNLNKSEYSLVMDYSLYKK